MKTLITILIVALTIWTVITAYRVEREYATMTFYLENYDKPERD